MADPRLLLSRFHRYLASTAASLIEVEAPSIRTAFLIPSHLKTMASSVRLLSAAAIFGLCTLQIAAQRRTENIVYSTDAAGVHKGDLYEPTGNGPFAAMVFLHGGAWRSGSKKEFRRMGTDLAQRGYASFAIDYDLRSHSFPLSWEEARAALRYLREHATEYRIDPNRIVVSGTSAGGELASLLALAPQGPATQRQTDEPVENVSGAVIFNGVFDLCYPVWVIKRYLGGNCASRKDVYTDASPVTHLHAGAPPFFVGHGTHDRVVPYKAAEMFVADLQKAGISVTPYIAEDGPHMYWTKAKYYQGNLDAVEKFLVKTVGDGSRAQGYSAIHPDDPMSASPSESLGYALPTRKEVRASAH